MHAEPVATRPRWVLTARSLSIVGVLLALLTLLLTAAVVLHERQQAIDTALARAELLARVLEEHATRSIDTASLALAALGDALGADGPQGTPRMGPALKQTLANLPLLRSVAVIDRKGQVLASTSPGLEGRTLAWDRLGPLPAPGADQLGRFVQGRSLGSLLPGALADAPAGVGFVPLVRALDGPGSGLLLVGLVNPDAIGNHQQLTLGREPGAALLASLDGQLLAATSELAPAPGARLPPLDTFTRYLPAREHAHYVGPGAAGLQQVVAFRASRTRPLVVQVELPLQAVLAPWSDDAWALGGTATAIALAVLLMTGAAARSQRGREVAQAEVAAREREMSVIVSSVRELIFRTDAAGRLVFMNPHWQAVSPVPLAHALTRPLAELVCAGSRPAAEALFALESDAAHQGPRSAQLSIGSGATERQFDISVTPLREHGLVMGFAGSAVDVTDRLASQARLREQLAFTELLFEMLPLPVSMLDADGRYVMVNQAWEAFADLHRDRVLGQPARRFLPPEEAERHDAQDRQLMAQGGSLQDEATRQARDGSRRDLSITKAAVPGPDGKPAGVLVAFMDVTEAREVERAVREARDAAEEASRAKSEFIANISHELRTPLQSIIGFSELGQVRGRDAPKLAGMFGDIHHAGQRMLALVNDLLDVAKIESTVGTFHLERTDLRPLVREVTRELEPLLAAKHLRAQLALGDLPLVAKVDPMRFQQVVRNVMANAIRFSPSGQAIDLHGELTAANEVQLSVRDHGPGIPAAEVEKIFEAFVQSSKTKDGSGGTGLGLAICRKIVQAQGGQIHACNADGGGSVFVIRLPARGFAESQAGSL